MQYLGNPSIEKLSRSMQCSSIGEIAAKAAVHFDGKLGEMLDGLANSYSTERADDALEWGVITANEREDLIAIYSLARLYLDWDNHENSVEEDLAVASLKTWKIAAQLPIERVLPTRAEQLQYVATVIASRLERRSKPEVKGGPLPEPDRVLDSDDWLPVVSM